MAKILETIYRISGEVSGSLLGAIATATNAMKGLRNAGNKFGNTFDVSQNKLGKMLTLLNRQNEALQKYKALQAAGVGKDGFNKYASELAKAAAELRRLGVAMKDVKSTESALKTMLTDVTNRLRQQTAARRVMEAQNANNIAGQNFSTAISNVQTSMSTAQSIMEPFVSATRTAMSYEAAVSRTKALTQMDHIAAGQTRLMEQEMSMLDARYKEIGRTTQFSATEAANAGNYLAMAGWNAEKINAGLPSVVNLAIASGSGVESAADILSNIQTGFGIGTSAQEIQHLSDVLTYTVTHSNQNLQQLGDTMKYVAPVAKMFGSSVEETSALTKFMADAGIQGSMAGTSLRATMLRLVAPPKKASKAMEENGITVDDASKAWVNANEIAAEYGITLDEQKSGGQQMLSIIQQINTQMAGLSTHEKMAAFSAITGINAVSGAMNIFEQDATTIDDFTKLLERSSEGEGAAAQTAAIMADNMQGSMVSMQSAMEAAAISVGNAFIPMLRPAVDEITQITRSVAEWAGKNPELIQGLGTIAATVAGGIVALSGFRVAMAGINFVQTTLELARTTAAFEVLKSTLGGGTTMFARLSIAANAFKTGGLIAGFQSIGTAIAGAGRAAMAFIATPWGAAIAGITVAVGLIIANWDKLAPYFSALAAKIKGIFEGISSFVTPLIDKIMAPFEKQRSLELQTKMKAETGEVVGNALELKQENLDELTRNTRAILRNSENKNDKTLADEIWSKMSEESQTDSSQVQMRSMLHEELSKHADLTDERRASIESDINERMYGAKASSIESVTKGLTEYASRQDLSKEADRAAFLSTAKAALEMRTDISSAEKAAILTEVKSRSESAAAGAAFENTLKTAVSEMKATTLSEQTALVNKMLAASEASNADLSTKRAAMENRIQTTEGLSETARSEMLAQMNAGLQTAMNARIGEQISSALEKSTDQTQLVAALTEVLSGQKDQSTEAMREMRTTMSESMKASGKFEAEQISSIVASVEKAVAARKESTREAQARETWSKTEAPVERQSPMQAASRQVPWMQTPWQAQTIAAPQGMMPDVSGANAALVGLTGATNAASNSMQTVGSTTSTITQSASTQAAAMQNFNAATLNGANALNVTASIAAGVNANVSGFGASVMNAAMSADASTGSIAAMSGAADGSTGSIAAMASTADGSTGSIAAMSGAAGEASGVLGGLGAAVSGAISGLMSAASSAGSAIMGVIGSATSAIGGAIGGHAEGGIFAKGAHLTWFAERSAEAAIPLDGSSRSIGLWRTVGAMLGVLPKDGRSEPMQTAMPGLKTPSIPIAPGTDGKEKNSESMLETIIKAATGSMSTSEQRPKAQSILEKKSIVEKLLEVMMPRTPDLKTPNIPIVPRSKDTGSVFDAVMNILPSMSGGGSLVDAVMKILPSSGVQNPKPQSILEERNPTFEIFNELMQTAFKPIMTMMPQVEGILPSALTAIGGNAAIGSAMPPIEVHFHFAGNVDREDVKRGVEESMPGIRETFEEQLQRHLHEKSRRSI